MKYIGSVYSPAYPAALLLYGMIFALAGAHFMAVSWSRPMTITLYTVPLVWTLALIWREHRRLLPITTLDVLFVGFVLVVLTSIIFQGGFQGGAGKYARYLPFMAIVPYLCGRLMRVRSEEHTLNSSHSRRSRMPSSA